MLVDRLEAVINGGWRPPLSNKVTIDEREALDVLDLMRTTVPEEIKQARRLNQEREKILAQAQTEANRLVTQAQERAQRIVSEDNIHVMAEERGRGILDEAERDAEKVRQEADRYALRMLDRLDSQLSQVDGEFRHIHASVRAAIDQLREQMGAPAVSEEV